MNWLLKKVKYLIEFEQLDLLVNIKTNTISGLSLKTRPKFYSSFTYMPLFKTESISSFLINRTSYFISDY